MNTYGYVGGNPILQIDPYGLFRWDLFDIGDATTWPSFDQSTVDFSAGFGDTLSFGATSAIRDAAGIGGVNKCSGAYSAGEWAGDGFSIATGFVGGTKAVAKAKSLHNWQNFSHSAFPKRFLKKFDNRFAKWLNKTGNRLNGDYITPELHLLIDKVAATTGKSLEWQRANPPYRAWRRAINRIPYTPGGAAFGLGGMGANNGLNGSECGCS